MTTITLDRHLTEVCKQYGVDRKSLLGPSKEQHLLGPRRKLLYRLAVDEGISTSVTGRMVGKRDHSTVLYNVWLEAEANGWPPRTSILTLRAVSALGKFIQALGATAQMGRAA